MAAELRLERGCKRMPRTFVVFTWISGIPGRRGGVVGNGAGTAEGCSWGRAGALGSLEQVGLASHRISKWWVLSAWGLCKVGGLCLFLPGWRVCACEAWGACDDV